MKWRTGRRQGNDQVRFELTVMALDPPEDIAPWREWEISSRAMHCPYAAKHNVPDADTVKSHLLPRCEPLLFHMKAASRSP